MTQIAMERDFVSSFLYSEQMLLFYWRNSKSCNNKSRFFISLHSKLVNLSFMSFFFVVSYLYSIWTQPFFGRGLVYFYSRFLTFDHCSLLFRNPREILLRKCLPSFHLFLQTISLRPLYSSPPTTTLGTPLHPPTHPWHPCPPPNSLPIPFTVPFSSNCSISTLLTLWLHDLLSVEHSTVLN